MSIPHQRDDHREDDDKSQQPEDELVHALGTLFRGHAPALPIHRLFIHEGSLSSLVRIAGFLKKKAIIIPQIVMVVRDGYQNLSKMQDLPIRIYHRFEIRL